MILIFTGTNFSICGELPASASFSPARRDLLLGIYPVTAEFFDHDLDGFTDIAVILGRSNGKLQVIEGTSSGGLRSIFTIDCGEHPGDLGILKLNGDEFPDIVITREGDGSLLPLFNDGEGGFIPGESFPVGPGLSILAVANIVEDLRDEVLITRASNLLILKSEEEGFRNEQELILPDIPTDFEVEDFDTDGYMDVLIGYGDLPAERYRGGEGGLLYPPEVLDLGGVSALESADIDMDGNPDILALDPTGDYTMILWGSEGGSFRYTSFRNEGSPPSAVFAGTPGEGGLLDLCLISGENGSVEVMEGRRSGIAVHGTDPRGDGSPPDDDSIILGSYRFIRKGKEYRCGRQTVWAGLQDIDADGIPDLLALNQGSWNLSLFYGMGGGYYEIASDFAAGGGSLGVKSVVVLDANEDGFDDVAIAYRRDNAISILLGDGEGNLILDGTYPMMGDGTHTLATGDLNEDNHEDVIVRSVSSASVCVLLGDGEAGFEAIGEFPTAAGTHFVNVADINGDDYLDVLTPNSIGRSVTILLGDGTGRLEPIVDVAVGTGPHGGCVLDHNGDDLPDYVTANLGEDSVAVLTNVSGTLVLTGKIPVGNGPISVTCGDYNEDGNPDLAVGNFIECSITIALGLGSGEFEVAGTIPAGKGPHSIATLHLDDDGHLDLVSALTGMDSVLSFYGDGDGNFFGEEYHGVNNQPNTIAVGDFNDDGLEDVVTANVGTHDVTVLLNNTQGMLRR